MKALIYLALLLLKNVAASAAVIAVSFVIGSLILKLFLL